jgi:hypothetical protein
VLNKSRFLNLTVVNLTLVDLPGLTKNAVGDQDPLVVHQVSYDGNGNIAK